MIDSFVNTSIVKKIHYSFTPSKFRKNHDIPFRIRVGLVGHVNSLNQVQHDQLLTKFKELMSARSMRDLFETGGESQSEITANSKALDSITLEFSVVSGLSSEVERELLTGVLSESLVQYEAILDAPVDEYLSKIVNIEERSQADALIKKCRKPVVLSHEKKEHIPRQDMVYDFLCKYVDVMVVVCNEHHKDSIFMQSFNSPVIHMTAGDNIEMQVVKNRGIPIQAVHDFNKFNQYLIRNSLYDKYTKNLSEDLLPNSRKVKIPENVLAGIKETLFPYYVRGSVIAKDYQTQYLRAGWLVYCLAPLAVACVAVGVLAPAIASWAFLIEFFLLLTIFATVSWADRNKAHKHWIENRFFTERIRDSVFKASVGVEAGHLRYHRLNDSHHDVNDWTTRAFQEVWNKLPKLNGVNKEKWKASRDYIVKKWIEDQIDYHKKKIGVSDSKATIKIKNTKGFSKRLERIGMIVFFVALLSAALHSIPHFVGIDLHAHWFEVILVFFAISLPGVGAAIGGFRAHRDYSRIVKNSENMYYALKQLLTLYRNLESHKGLEVLLHHTEELMLQETQGWLALMRFVELEAEC